jgi:hypothetical protein
MHENRRSLDVIKQKKTSCNTNKTIKKSKNIFDSPNTKYVLINLKAYRPTAKQLNAQIGNAEQQQQKLLNGPSMGSIAERRGQINLADLPVKIVPTYGQNPSRTNLGQKQQPKCLRSPYEELSLELKNGDGQIHGNNGGGGTEFAQGNGSGNNCNKMESVEQQPNGIGKNGKKK